jgi:prolyl 4-hydroxylase
MVWLGDQCEGGGTRFPRLEKPKSEAWCRFIECGEDDNGDGSGADENDMGMGVTFKPMKGNAVYWENMKTDGMGYEESWHAGLPVTSGTKIGLNIWSWLQDGYDPDLPQDVV